MQFLSKVKIGENGEQLPADAQNHVAVLLPALGLMFTATVINREEATQTDLEKQCGTLSVAGFNDWRLPSIDELQLVIDRIRSKPALDPSFFRDIPLDWLWSSTALSGNPDYAWYVNADDGSVDNGHRYDSGFALAVRSAGQ